MTFWALPASDAPALALGHDAASFDVVTYRQLATLADAFVASLGERTRKRLGVILCANAVAPIAAYLGALRAGDAVMLLNAQIANAPLATIVDAYRPDWILQPQTRDVPYGWRVIDVAGNWATLVRDGIAADAAAIHADLAVLLSTSGTTGSPKMVRLSYRNLDTNARAIVEYLSIGADERAITTLPFNYAYGLSIVNSHLAAGAALVPTDESLVSREFWSRFALHGVTSLAGVPYTYEILHRLNPERLGLATLRTLTQAGGRLAPRLVEWFRDASARNGWRFFVMYGQTEAAPRISYVPPQRLAAKAGSIGIAIPGGHLSLSPDGELVYEGPNVMLGYALARDDLARGDDLGGRLATGDLARVDDDGYYFLLGRLGRYIKVHGNRVSLDDIERALEDRFGVAVAVTGRDDRFEVFLAGGDADAAKAFVVDAYRLHHSTFAVRLIAEIPRSASGKKDYAALTP
jgi:acyl-CoA synthetase (AMP-forming)/AMP-acid ligase II